MHRSISLTLVLATALASGCMHTARTEVHATATFLAIPAGSYRLIWTPIAGSADDPRVHEAKIKLQEALATHGLQEAPADSSADLLIMVDCNLGARKLHETTISDIPPPTRDMDGRVREMDTHVTFTRASEASYEKHLAITAYENRPTSIHPKARQAWRVEVSTDDESPDLAKYLPGLVAAGVGYINTNSQETIRVAMTGTGS